MLKPSASTVHADEVTPFPHVIQSPLVVVKSGQVLQLASGPVFPFVQGVQLELVPTVPPISHEVQVLAVVSPSSQSVHPHSDGVLVPSPQIAQKDEVVAPLVQVWQLPRLLTLPTVQGVQEAEDWPSPQEVQE